MKKVLIALTTLTLVGCHSHINKSTKVVSIESFNGEEKWRVELEFIGANQFLYTDSFYNVGDVLILTPVQ